MNNRFFLVFLWVALSMTGCGRHSPSDSSIGEEIVTVVSRPLTTHLYYAGTIQPLKSAVITSPSEGVVEEMEFHYGDKVKAQQPLFIVSSGKFQADYKNALMQYIKAKTDYNNSYNKFKADEFLYKNALISNDALKADQTSYLTQQLSLIQAKDTLTAMLKQLDIKNLDFEKLEITDIEKISTLLRQQDVSQKIHVTSPAAGVILLSSKDENDLAIKINKGSQVKQGDILAVIGDVSGVGLRINVNEFNINQLKIGQKVKVTGTAFPMYTLEGQIAGLDHQGQTAQSGVPVFPVEILVPHLTPEQQSIIHVGMSAKVEINLIGPPVVTVPIKAVYTKNNIAYVKAQDQGGRLMEVSVKTGQTTEDAVVIEAPLKPGDKVAVPH